MLQKLPAKSLSGSKILLNLNFMKNYKEESDEGYFLEIDVQYPEKLHELDNNLPERMKIEKAEKLVANLNYKAKYVTHIRNLKQGINHGFLLKKFIE